MGIRHIPAGDALGTAIHKEHAAGTIERNDAFRKRLDKSFGAMEAGCRVCHEDTMLLR
jgi:hypothetical protein